MDIGPQVRKAPVAPSFPPTEENVQFVEASYHIGFSLLLWLPNLMWKIQNIVSLKALRGPPSPSSLLLVPMRLFYPEPGGSCVLLLQTELTALPALVF